MQRRVEVLGQNKRREQKQKQCKERKRDDVRSKMQGLRKSKRELRSVQARQRNSRQADCREVAHPIASIDVSASGKTMLDLSKIMHCNGPEQALVCIHRQAAGGWRHVSEFPSLHASLAC